ncbi:hypothetical protein L3Q82_009944, partial [Scortum barcoo]
TEERVKGRNISAKLRERSVSDMSDGYFEILRESLHKRNHIPSGRQLPRTPPLADVKRHLDFCNEDQSEGCEVNKQCIISLYQDLSDKNKSVVLLLNQQEGTRDEGDNDQNRTFDVHTPVTKTATWSSFEKMKEEKLIKRLQGDLEEVQRLLKKEMMAEELACATKEKAQAELRKFPSCEDLTEWAKVVFEVTSPTTETAHLDLKSLLAEVTEENIQRAAEEKEAELSRMKRMIANKRRKEAEERGQIEKQIASEQLKLHTLMSQLSDLKSELAQEEEAYKALEMQLNTQEAAEIKVEADTPEEPRAAKSQVRRGKERKKAVKSPEKLQDTTNQSKSKKSKRTDQTGVKDDQKTTGETLKAKQKSGAATGSVKAARGPQKKAEEGSDSPVRAARGRRKPAGSAQAATSQPKNQSKTDEARPTKQAAPSRGRQKAAVAAEEAQNAGLRRSKRIASRR